MMIGVRHIDHKNNEDMAKLSQAYGLSSNGILYGPGFFIDNFSPRLRSGDIITVEVNSKEGSVFF